MYNNTKKYSDKCNASEDFQCQFMKISMINKYPGLLSIGKYTRIIIYVDKLYEDWTLLVGCIVWE